MRSGARAVCALVVAGCGGGGGGVDGMADAAPVVDATGPDASWFGACETDGLRFCIHDRLAECQGGVQTELQRCALGCSTAGGAHCRSFVPSNLEAFDQVFAAGPADLVIEPGVTVVLDTDLLSLSPGPVEVDTFVRAQPGEAELAVYRFRRVRIEGRLEIRGSRLAVITASEDAVVSGAIEVVDGISRECGIAAVGDQVGGGGGGFGFRGGAGGALGDDGGGVTGGDYLIGTEALTPLISGCDGGPGSGGAAGAPGITGGAVHIVAAERLEILGSICVSGHGGRSSISAGGGGGGSGGAVLLESLEVVLGDSAAIVSNGGAGGGGGSAESPGGVGQRSCDVQTRPYGGAGSTPPHLYDGTGGRGAHGLYPAWWGQGGVAGLVASGGGGGGVGKIRINAANGAITWGGQLSGVPSAGNVHPE